MSAKDNLSSQFNTPSIQEKVDWLGGTLMPHSEGGYVLTLSQRLGDHIGIKQGPLQFRASTLEEFNPDHPVISKLLDRYDKYNEG